MGNSIPEQIVAQVFSLLPVGTQTAVGERERETHAKPPRVVAVLRGAPVIRQPDRTGDPKFTDQGRILLVREFDILWQCHGVPASEGAVDFSVAETLYLNTIRAVRQITHNAARFSDERWIDQEEGQDSFERFGTVIEFTSMVQIPIYEPRSTLVPLTAVPKIATTMKLPDDGSGETVTINEG